MSPAIESLLARVFRQKRTEVLDSRPMWKETLCRPGATQPEEKDEANPSARLPPPAESRPGFGEHLLPELLLAFSDAHPDYRIDSRVGYSRSIQTRLATGLAETCAVAVTIAASFRLSTNISIVAGVVTVAVLRAAGL